MAELSVTQWNNEDQTIEAYTGKSRAIGKDAPMRVSRQNVGSRLWTMSCWTASQRA